MKRKNVKFNMLFHKRSISLELNCNFQRKFICQILIRPKIECILFYQGKPTKIAYSIEYSQLMKRFQLKRYLPPNALEQSVSWTCVTTSLGRFFVPLLSLLLSLLFLQSQRGAQSSYNVIHFSSYLSKCVQKVS